MLEMGEPVNIFELAKRMIRLSGQAVGTDVPVQIVGRRPGEKLIEELHSPNEDLRPTVHPSIVQISPRTLLSETLDASLLRLAAFAREGRDRTRPDSSRASLVDHRHG